MNLSVLIYTRQAWQVPIGLGLPTVTQAQLCKYISHNSTYNPQQTSVTCRNVDTVFLTGNCYREKWKMTDGKCLKECLQILTRSLFYVQATFRTLFVTSIPINYFKINYICCVSFRCQL